MPIPVPSEGSGVTLDDVAIGLGRPLSSGDEQAQVDQWIGDAEMQIRVRLGDLSLLDSGALAYVVREAVIARLRNPEGYQSESVDDYTYRHGSETRRVTILPEWWELLSPSRVTGAFSTRPTFEPGDTEPDPWVTTTEQT